MALTEREILLIEGDLLGAIKIFQEGTFSKKEVNQMINEYFQDFCIKNSINPKEAYEHLAILLGKKTSSIATIDYKKGLKAIELPNDDSDQR